MSMGTPLGTAGPSATASSSASKRGLGTADIALAVLVVAIVAMMIVPLPTHLLDVLLAANLSAAVAVLLVVLYVPDALAVAAFPTLLLITTLFRLALNVSSSRLILLQADAGDVIKAFGEFVVRGNYVVGAVIFLILTIIQFVVIAKGSERVAEVGARFVLDAMPGKQMAIDAELRAGSIDGNEARRRRHKLARESQFYGAMDGAMKFVKGDVIATVIITIINVLGGLAIGVAQRGMPVEAALKKYGLLTIGDGLVSQIPALVLSTAAGLLVTRTASEEPDTPLGADLAQQLFSTPKALRVASVFVVLLGVVPGLPALPFLAIGGGLFWVAHSRTKTLRKDAEKAQADPVPAQAQGTGRKGPHFLPVLVPWSVELSPDLHESLPDSDKLPGVISGVQALRDSLFLDTGVPLPPPRIRTAPGLPERSVLVSLFEIPARLVALPAECTGSEITPFVVGQADAVLRTRAQDYIGLNETQKLLDELEQFSPALVRNVVPKPVTVAVLADVLRRLVEERVSVRDLRAILEALATVAGTEKDPLNLTEYVRSQLRRAITYRVAGGGSALTMVTLDPIIEDTVRRAVTRTPSGSFLSLAPAAARDVVTSIRRAYSEAQGAGATGTPVLLTQPDIRRFVRKLIETDLPDVDVLSFAELLPEIALRPVGRAHLGGIG